MAETSASDTSPVGGGRDREESAHSQRPSVGTFVAQIVAELRKVVRPTQRELLTYTIVVLVFVAVMIGLVFGLDQVFSTLVGLVLGG